MLPKCKSFTTVQNKGSREISCRIPDSSFYTSLLVSFLHAFLFHSVLRKGNWSRVTFKMPPVTRNYYLSREVCACIPVCNSISRPMTGKKAVAKDCFAYIIVGTYVIVGSRVDRQAENSSIHSSKCLGKVR